MRLVLLAVLASLAVGCGYQIGASCLVDTDCSADGTRSCDQTQPDGYCTILGCDYNTCPDSSECVRFYTGSFANEPCDYQTEDGSNGSGSTNSCSYDELCSIADQCVPRAAEIRYCMANCSSNGDCRDGYECRFFDSKNSQAPFQLGSMQEDGGEVVLGPGLKDNAQTTGFCAPIRVGS